MPLCALLLNLNSVALAPPAYKLFPNTTLRMRFIKYTHTHPCVVRRQQFNMRTIRKKSRQATPSWLDWYMYLICTAVVGSLSLLLSLVQRTAFQATDETRARSASVRLRFSLWNMATMPPVLTSKRFQGSCTSTPRGIPISCTFHVQSSAFELLQRMTAYFSPFSVCLRLSTIASSDFIPSAFKIRLVGS